MANTNGKKARRRYGTRSDIKKAYRRSGTHVRTGWKAEHQGKRK